MLTRLLTFTLALSSLVVAYAAQAEIRTETINYRDGDVELQGYLAWDDSASGKRPGILVVHEWWGLNDYARHRARMLAELGYVAFAGDMYGKGMVTEHANQAKAWYQQITANIGAWQRRAQLGLDILRQRDQVDPKHLAAIGYCFGGATVMQLAYSGADLDGVVSFHGSLPPATKEQQGQIKASILAAHGSADGFVPPERVAAFEQALNEAGADWQLVAYGGARHGFTNPDAGHYGMENIAYNAEADARSWALMQTFLDEVLNRR